MAPVVFWEDVPLPRYPTPTLDLDRFMQHPLSGVLFVRPEEPLASILGVSAGKVEEAIPIHKMHQLPLCLEIPRRLLAIPLDDTERVDPDVLDPEGPGHGDGVLEGLGELVPVHANGRVGELGIVGLDQLDDFDPAPTM